MRRKLLISLVLAVPFALVCNAEETSTVAPAKEATAEITVKGAHYIVPQEPGNKTGVRWAKVTDKRGRGLLFTGDGMNFSALPWTPHEMENARHPYELPAVHYTVIRTSLAQMGIAGDDSWGAKTHPEYLLPADGHMEFTFRFRGI